MDGANNLGPRPTVRSIEPWQTVSVALSDKQFEITVTIVVGDSVALYFLGYGDGVEEIFTMMFG